MMPGGGLARKVADALLTLRSVNHGVGLLTCSILVVASPLFADVKIRVREGRPIADNVYVNGHGPYSFIIDTGTNINLIESGLARRIGMEAAFQVDLASSTGVTSLPGSDGNEVELGTAKACEQKFLFSDLNAIRRQWTDVDGVLGQWFLSRFDYLLDLHGKRLVFGRQDVAGKRTRITTLNGRTAFSTSLGDLVLDSGASQLILFGTEPDGSGSGFLRTVTGSRMVGMVARSLVIGGRNLWRGDAVAIPNQAEPGVAGLMPASLFRSIYVSNSEGYAIFE